MLKLLFNTLANSEFEPTGNSQTATISDDQKRSIMEHYITRIEELIKMQPAAGFLERSTFLIEQIITRTSGWLHFERIESNPPAILGYMSGILLLELDYMNSQMPKLSVPIISTHEPDRNTCLKNFLTRLESSKGNIELDNIIQEMRVRFGSELLFPTFYNIIYNFQVRQIKICTFVKELITKDEPRGEKLNTEKSMKVAMVEDQKSVVEPVPAVASVDVAKINCELQRDEELLKYFVTIYKSAPFISATDFTLFCWIEGLCEKGSFQDPFAENTTARERSAQDGFKIIMNQITTEINELSTRIKEQKMTVLVQLLKDMPGLDSKDIVLLQSMKIIRQTIGSWVMLPKYNDILSIVKNYALFRDAIVVAMKELTK